MRLVVDREWEVCYIEVTKAEAEVLQWPPWRTSAELAQEAKLVLAGLRPTYDREPEGYRELATKAHDLAREARPFYQTIRRAEPPELMLYGIETRIVG